LNDTILKGRGYQLVQNVDLVGEARFPVYSSSNLHTGSGIVLYIEFEALGSPGDQTLLALSRFRCNESTAAGGFYVQNVSVSELNIVVNAVPTANNMSSETMEDEPTILSLSGQDTDIADTLTFSLETQPTLGIADLSQTTGQLTYTPNENISGTDVFSFKVFDGVAFSEPAFITILIQSGNDSPIAKPSTKTTDEDTPFSFTLSALDPDGDDLTYQLDTMPDKGELILVDSISGECQYTPEMNIYGKYFFQFTAYDELGASNSAQITIVIDPVNDAPVAIAASYTLNEDEPLVIQLNATDIDSMVSGYDVVEDPIHGQIQWINTQTGEMTFTPEQHFNGNISFDFFATDGIDSSEPATIQLTVIAVNDPPIANSDSIQTNEDVPISFSLTGTDIENDPLSFAIQTEPDMGTWEINSTTGTFTYTPVEEYSGTLNFTFTAFDGQDQSEPSAITIIIAEINDPPIAQDADVTTAEDESVFFALKATDIDSEIESYEVQQPQNGDIILLDAVSGLCKYTPATNYFGMDFLTFKAKDADNESASAQITITITPVNDAPVAESMSLTGKEDQTTYIQLLGFDADEEPLTFTIISQPSHGQLINLESATGTVQYVPDTDYYGSDQFLFSVTDGTLTSQNGLVSLDISYVNDPPFVQSDAIVVAEDSSANDYTLIAYDEDSEITEYTITRQPAHGEVIFVDLNKGLINYVPEEDYFGEDSFEFKALDDYSASDAAIISVTVTPSNDLPVGYPKTFEISEDDILMDYLSFDDPDYDMLTITVYTPANHGLLTITDRRTGAFTYTPTANFSGMDYIVFEACDMVACSGPVSMTFIINSVNDPPVALPQKLTLTEDQPISITLTGKDIEHNLSGFEIVSNPQGLLETIDQEKGIFLYTPLSDSTDIDAFQFIVMDESESSEPATVTLVILPVNDVPSGQPIAYTILEDNALEGQLQKSDPDGDELTLTIKQDPNHGWVTSIDHKNGEFSYVPAINYYGIDIFWYNVCDATLCSEAIPVTVNIQSVNDAPTVASATYELAEDTAIQITLVGIDIESQDLTFEIVNFPDSGNAAIVDMAKGIVVYTPYNHLYGDDTFTYKVYDGEIYSEPADIQLTIYSVNDQPIAIPDEIEMIEDQSYSGGVTASDADNDELIFSIFQKPKKGKLVMSESGAGQGNFVYTPYLNANGMDAFWFHVFDGEAYSDPQPVTITIQAINDPPKADDAMFFINAGEEQEWILNASDAEADAITFVIVQQPEKGTVELLDSHTGTIRFIASSSAEGTDTIIFQVTDGKLFSEESAISISINPAGNHQPVAKSMILTVTEDIETYFTLDASDEDNNQLNYVIYQEPTKGDFSFTNAHTGESVYKSLLNAQGMDHISYYVSDGIVNSDPAHITLIIQSMPQTVIPKQKILSVPVVLDEEKNISSLNIQVTYKTDKMRFAGLSLDNTILSQGDYGFSSQTGIDGDYSVAAFPISSQGAEITDKGIVAYVQFEILGNEGEEVFLTLSQFTCNETKAFGGFQLNDAISAKIRLMINEMPIAYDGYLIIDEDQSITYQLIGYDVNMTDPISYTIVSYPEKGQLTLVNASTGHCLFSTTPDANGTDSFAYQSFDGKDYSEPATIQVTINPINDKPVAYPASLTALEDIPTESFQLMGEDLADATETLIYKLSQKPANGRVILHPIKGTFMYESNENFYGQDTFSYVVDDGIDKSDPALVNIMIISVNDAPVSESLTQTTNEDTAIAFDLVATDPENDLFEYGLSKDVEFGTLSLNPINGHCTYIPDDGYSGLDYFEFTMTDVHGASSYPVQLNIQITPENDPPVVTEKSFETNEDQELEGTLEAIDQDQDAVTFVIITDPDKGSIQLNSQTGDFIYSPRTNENGADTFVVAAKDQWVSSENVQMSINIIPVNDPPTADAGTSYQITERHDIILDGTGSVDIDGDSLTYLWTIPDIPNLSIINANTATPTLTAPYVDEAGQTITVSLTVTDPGNESNQSSATVSVSNMSLPDVSFSAAPYTGMVPLNVAFHDQSTGMPERWSWEFGDGTTSTKQNPEHVYTSSGVYTVSLTAEGPGGESSFVRTDYITVSYQNLSVDFSVDDRQGTVPHTVTFTPDILGEVDTWQWNFGDGTVSYDFEAVHTYQETGEYTVSLMASGPGGSDQKTYENWIQINGHVIKGQVVGANNSEPLSGYRVELHKVDSFVAATITDDNGQYSFSDLLPSSQYVVSAWPPENNNQYVYQYFSNAETLYDATYLETNIVTIADFSLALAPNAKITGKVTDGIDPISGIQVDIYSNLLEFGKNATTDHNGVYTITGLKEASDYIVSVYSEDLDKEFFFAIQENGTVGVDQPEMSVMNINQATQISPSETGLEHIDIIVSLTQGAAIEGNVVDTSNNPIEGMRVNAWSDTLKLGGNAITDSQGHYKISGLTSVSSMDAENKGYVVEIQPNGYMYQLFDQTTIREDAQLVETGRSDINFKLITTASVSGTVTDLSGSPIENARVRIYAQSNPTGNQAETTTDADGTYKLDALPIGSDYILLVEAQGYPIYYYDSQMSVDDATTLDLRWGPLQAKDMQLDKGPVIQGQIHDLVFGIPALEGTPVNIRSDILGIVKSTKTFGDGYFQFTGLDDSVSDYIISVVVDDYLPAYYRDNQNGKETDDTVYNYSEALFVSALPENSAPQCHLVLLKGVSIKGLVSYQGNPVSGAIVEAQSDNGSLKTITTDGTETNYTITGLLSGLYQITVTSDQYQTKIISDVNIQADTSENIELENLPRYFIKGTVNNLPSGKQIQIMARSQSKNIQKSIILVGTGDALPYSVDDLIPASDYTLELQSTDYANQYYDSMYDINDAIVLDVSNSSITDIDFTITIDLTTIQGTLTFPDSAINGDTVRLEVKSESTGVEGFIEKTYEGNLIVSYAITGLLPLNDYVLQLRSNMYQNRYWDGSDRGIAQIENAVAIDTTSGMAVADFLIDDGVSLSGLAKDADGNGLSNVQIEVWSDLSKIQRITQTSETGTYQVKGLALANDYKVKATTSSNTTFYYNNSESVRTLAQASTISTHSGNVENINITISKGVSITGNVRALDGQALSGIWVNAWSESIQVGAGAFSNDDGSFNIVELPEAQDYRLTAKPEWNLPYQSTEQSNVVAPATGLNLMLSPKTGFTVKGMVTGPSGSAVKDALVEIQSSGQPDNYGWSKTDVSGAYAIDLLPKASDYVIKVKPPEDTTHSFYTNNIEIEQDMNWNVMLDIGYVFSGTVVSKDDPTPIAEAVLSVWSESTQFYGESTTNSKGEYNIGNVPMSSDYQITVKKSPYLDYKASDQSPKTDTIRELENGGLIKGYVRSLLTGEVIPEASIEIYSQSNQGIEVYNGVASTNQDGYYSVAGLKPVDDQSNEITDFVVTVFAVGFPPTTKTGKKLGDTVSFDLTRGPENEISGTIQNAGTNPVAIDIFEVTYVNQERTDKFVKTVMPNDDNSFLLDGLRATGQFVLKFVTILHGVEYSEWAGTDDKGVENVRDAKLYSTESTISFVYSNLSGRKRISQYASYEGPGPVRNLRSLSHDFRRIGIRYRAAQQSGPDKPSNDPNVTVTWEPPDEGSSNIAGYFSSFSQQSDQNINKFNVVPKPPVRTRKITSRNLEGDDVSYYFHVAPVDKDGKIGKTTSIAFRIDTTPPTNVQVIAPDLTNDRNIQLVLGSTGASEMYISNISYLEGGQWENRSVNRTWQITDGDGTKNIYSRFRDRAGNTANAAAITLYEPPKPTFIIHAESGIYGSITPTGYITVTQGDQLEFQLIPDDEFLVNQLLLDNNPQTVSNNRFVLENIQAPHQIMVTFKESNSPPIAHDQTIHVTEDITYSGQLTATDPENDNLIFKMITLPDNGTLNLSDDENGNFSYIPIKNDNNTYTAQFTVYDGKLTSNTATLTIIIDPVNDKPQAEGQVVETGINEAKQIELLATDIDSENLQYEIVVQPSHGTVEIVGNIATYSPDTDFRNNDTFKFKVSDGEFDSDEATIKIRVGVPEADLVMEEDVLQLLDIEGFNLSAITVEPQKGSIFQFAQSYYYSPSPNEFGEDAFTYQIDDEPITFSIFILDVNDSPELTSSTLYTMNEDDFLDILLTAEDVDGDDYTFEIESNPQHGELKISLPSLRYTPVANYNGVDHIQVRVADSFDSTTKTIVITVDPVNDRPVAKDQYLATNQSIAISFTLTATDVDTDDTLTYSIISDPQSGELEGNNRYWTFQPESNQWGLEEIRFVANDGLVNSYSATVYLYVGIPIVHAFGLEDKPIDIREGLKKFFGIDADERIYAGVPSHGKLSGTPFIETYTPEQDYFENDGFTFTTDAEPDHIQRFNIYVYPENDKPVINAPETIETQEDHDVSIAFTASDVESENLIYEILAEPEKGELSGTAPNITYIPETNDYGEYTLQVQVSDGSLTDSADITIIVHPVNDKPVAKAQTLKMFEDKTKTIVLEGTDTEGLPLNYAIKNAPAHGEVSILAGSIPGELIYTPEPDYNGNDSFDFVVNDGQLDSDLSTIKINIRNVNDVPKAYPDFITISASGSASGKLSATDNIYDKDILTYSIQQNATKGYAVITNAVTGAFTYYSYNFESGQDYFTFKVNDGYADSNTASMMVTISTPVEDLIPLTMNITGQYEEGTLYYYSFIDINSGEVVRDQERANTGSVDLQLDAGNYRMSVYSLDYELFEYPDTIVLAPDVSNQIDITLTTLTTPMPVLERPDVSHSMTSDGFTLNIIPNDNYFRVVVDDYIEITSTTWQWTPENSVNGIPDQPETGDVTYIVKMKVYFQDDAPVSLLASDYFLYTVTYISFISSEHADAHKDDNQKIFESTYGVTENVTYSEKEFYPLLGSTFKINLKDSEGRNTQVPIDIPSLSLKYLYIDDSNGQNGGNLDYNSSTDFYQIPETPGQTLTAHTLLIAKVNYYSFGKDSLGSAVDLTFEIAEGQPNAGAIVRYNPVHDSSGKRIDEMLQEKALQITLPLLLNTESKDYTDFRNQLIENSEVELFFNETGDGKEGFKKNKLSCGLQEDRDDVVLLRADHLTGIGFAIDEAPGPEPVSSECNDCDSCFVEITQNGNMLIAWITLFVMALGMIFLFRKFSTNIEM
jgi:PKD repeat protein